MTMCYTKSCLLLHEVTHYYNHYSSLATDRATTTCCSFQNTHT